MKTKSITNDNDIWGGMEKVDNYSKVAHTGTESTVVTDTLTTPSWNDVLNTSATADTPTRDLTSTLLSVTSRMNFTMPSLKSSQQVT